MFASKFIEKDWGSETLLEKNDSYVVKRLFMKKDHRCSLQYHEKKRETVYVLEGELGLMLERQGVTSGKLKRIVLYPGDHFTIEPGEKHRMFGIKDSVYLESSTPELDDVVRLEDDYGRVVDGEVQKKLMI